MNDKPFYMTAEGRRKLEEELEYLIKVRRPELARLIHEAKAEGDVMENAGYDEAKNAQAFIEGRIMTLETMLRNAVLIDKDGPSERVSLGSRVTVVEVGRDEPETYYLVGTAEADPANGRISNESPLGRALMNARVGDQVVVDTPGGRLTFQIVSIE